ncbi:MAG: branched chain amino acid aminotransferase, partial [Gardnerella vaginalis]
MADLEVAPDFKNAYDSYDHSDSDLLNKLAGNFTVLTNDNPVSDAKRAELIDKPAFGQIFS